MSDLNWLRQARQCTPFNNFAPAERRAGRKTSRRGRIAGLTGILTLGLLSVVPVSLAGAPTASAAENPCTPGNCAPTGVTFFPEGSGATGVFYSQNSNQFPPALSSLTVCGIEGEYAPLATTTIDSTYDDPSQLKGYTWSYPGEGSYISGTTEGNYTDSEAFQFTPATQLAAGDTVTVSLPSPSEPYSPSGSILPGPQVGLNVANELAVEQSTAQVFVAAQATGNTNSSWVIEVKGVPNGNTVRLDKFNPYSPPPVGNGPGPNPTDSTSASILGYNQADNNYETGNTSVVSGGVASFEVTDSQAEDVTFGATDVTAGNLGLLQTATVSFNGGTTNPTGPCASDPSVPSTQGDGLTYVLVVNGIGYLVPQVVVNSSAGVESATLTVPPGVPTTSGPVVVEVVDAVSPPGQGTPSNPVAAYPADDFSISTSADPVPGFPATAPTFQGDAGSNLANFPVDGSNSTLTVSSPTQQVGNGTGSTLSATTTLRDQYNNPVNDKQVSTFQLLGSHANVAPQTPPTNTPNPTTGNDGTVSYTVSDSCAETVELESEDVDDNVPVLGPDATSGATRPKQVPVTFTPGPAVAPDGTRTLAQCNVPPVTSQVQVVSNGTTFGPGTVANAAADGITSATVNVTLGDQFGNADSCQQVILAPTSQTSHANVVPEDPANPCPGDDQPGYTGRDGVATFAVTDATAEQVVLGVSDTTVVSVWPVDPSANADDVAQVNFEPVDATQSTVTANPTTAPADGQPASTVTVTLKDASGQAEQGKSVTLSGCSNVPTSSPCTVDPTTTITPASATTNSNGQATFQVADNSPSPPLTVYYQATVPSDDVTVGQVASVNFTKGGVSLSANPTTVIADGVGTSTATFTLQDANGNPIPNALVFVGSAPQIFTHIVELATDADGQAQFSFNSTQTGPVTISASVLSTAGSGPCTGLFECGASATVDFLPPPSTFNLSASPSAAIPADGTSSSQVTLTALGPNGQPEAGIPVSLVATGSNGGTPLVTPSSAMTDPYGQATFSVTDTVPENVTLTGAYEEIGDTSGTTHPGTACTASSCNTTVNFAPTEGEQSTLTATASTTTSTATAASAPADGSSPVTVTVTLLAGSGSPIAGHPVALTTKSRTAEVSPLPATNFDAKTNSSGQVQFAVTDTEVETVTLEAQDLSTGAVINQVLTVSFTGTEAQLSTVAAAPSSLAAGGPPGAPNTTTVTVTLGLPASLPPGCPSTLSGHMVELTASSGSVNVSPAVSTNGAGVAVFAVSDPKVQQAVLTATDTTCGVTLDQAPTVSFQAAEANQSTVMASPVSTPAGGQGTTLTVTLHNASGQAISGETVTVPAVDGATVTPQAAPGLDPGETNSAGVAQFLVSDDNVGPVTLAAYDGTVELDAVATVTFTANEANQSTVVAAPASLPAVGATTTVVVKLSGGGGYPIAGDAVSLLANSSTVSVSPGTATTNSNGVALFTVSDSAVQDVELSALDMTSGVMVVQTATVDFTANEANQSSASASPAGVQVDRSSTVTVTLRDSNGNPVSGETVTLATGSATATATVAKKGSDVTNAQGQAQFSIKDSAPETLSVTVTDETTGVTLYKPVNITFSED